MCAGDRPGGWHSHDATKSGLIDPRIPKKRKKKGSGIKTRVNSKTRKNKNIKPKAKTLHQLEQSFVVRVFRLLGINTQNTQAKKSAVAGQGNGKLLCKLRKQVNNVQHMHGGQG